VVVFHLQGKLQACRVDWAEADIGLKAKNAAKCGTRICLATDIDASIWKLSDG
jgi:hypothetical protein